MTVAPAAGGVGRSPVAAGGERGQAARSAGPFAAPRVFPSSRESPPMPRFKFAALAAAVPLVFVAPAVGQDAVEAAALDTGETFVQSAGDVGVLISPDGSKIWGYSAEAGGLTPLPVDVPEAERGKVRPVVGGSVAMVVVDGVAYAYGGKSGEWGRQEIGDRENVVPIVGGEVAAIRVGGGVYAFSGVTGTGGLHPLAADEKTDGPGVGVRYVRVASDRGFGIFSAKAGKWGSVKYPEPPAGEQPEESAAGDDESDAESVRATVNDAVEELSEMAEELTEGQPVIGEPTADVPAAAEPAPAPPEGDEE